MGVPGNIYLCQAGGRVSCGACCGLYNLPEASEQAVRGLLSRRAAAFSRVPREMDAILAFGEAEMARLSGRLPMPEFHHCPYLGLIGPDNSRAGCLLHPEGAGNRGIDFRGLSYYGSMTCGMYFCPTHHRITSDFKKLILSIFDDWYLYGLIVPEADLLEALYVRILDRTGGNRIEIDPAGQPDAREALFSLFSLKIRWPFASPGRPLSNYFFNDRLYPKPAVDYVATGKSGSRYDDIFRELHSVFASAAELAQAEAHLDALFDRVAESLKK